MKESYTRSNFIRQNLTWFKNCSGIITQRVVNSDPITVFLVDDCSIIKDSLEYFFSITKEIRLVGCASNGAEAVPLLERCKPEVAVVDVLMPEINGFELAKAALTLHPDLRILFFSGMYSEAYVEHARKIGAVGWVVKGAPDELLSAIRTVVRTSDSFFSPDPSRPTMALPILTGPPMDIRGKGALTQRETEILRLWTQGLEVKAIAEELGITARTVEAHRAHIIRKTGTRSVAQLTKLALARGLIPF